MIPPTDGLTNTAPGDSTRHTVTAMSDHITVTGTGRASASPDVVAVRVRIECESEVVASALSGCTDAVGAALEVASRLDLPPGDRQTTMIGIHQRFDNEGRQVVGHTAFQALTLLVRDHERVGDLLTGLADAVGNGLRVEDISLEISDVTHLQQAAREAAFADARTRAQDYARLAGRTLGRVRTLTEESVLTQPYPRFAREALASTADGMPVETGESSVTQSVTVTFALRRDVDRTQA